MVAKSLATSLPPKPEPVEEPQLESPADRFERYRQAAQGLEEALARLAQLEAEVLRTQGELQKVDAEISREMDSDNADLDKLGAASVRRSAIAARLERLAAKVLGAQHDIQDRLSELANDLNVVYQNLRNGLIARSSEEISALLHPSAKVLQRTSVGYLAVFHKTVVEAVELEPSLHPLATQPLEDTLSRQWSTERTETMRVCRDECRRVLDALPTLLGAAKDVWPQASEPFKVQEAA